jgi:O-Antigen ligase
MLGHLSYLAYFLVSLNLVGADPADILFFLLIVFAYAKPGLRQLNSLVPGPIKFLTFTFFSSYIVSGFYGAANIAFVVNLISNCLFAIFTIKYIDSKQRMARVFGAMMYGNIILTLSSLVLSALSLMPGSIFFEVVRDSRLMGAVGDPNFLALYSSLVLIWIVDQFLRGNNSSVKTSWLVPLAISNVFIILLTQSRSSWAAIVMAMFMYVLLSPVTVFRRLFKYAIPAALLGVVLVGAALYESNYTGVVSDRLHTFSAQDSDAEEDRFKMVYTLAAIGVAIENPLGVGPGGAVTASGLLNADGEPIGSHNAYVQIFTDNGWLAGLSVILALPYAMRRLIGSARINATTFGVSNAAITAMLVETLIVGMFHDLMQWRIAWIGVALSLVALRVNDDREPALLLKAQ